MKIKFTRRTRTEYPLNFAFIKNRPTESKEIFLKKTIHKGVFIGLVVLEGTFPDGNGEEVFETLSIGEKLKIFFDKTQQTLTPLEVRNESEITVGYLSFPMSVLLSSLIEREIECFCFLEAKDDESGVLNLAVSVYCEEY